MAKFTSDYRISVSFTSPATINPDHFVLIGEGFQAGGEPVFNSSYSGTATMSYAFPSGSTYNNIFIYQSAFAETNAGTPSSYTHTTTGITAEIISRRPAPNSTTPSNTMVFNSYSYSLSTAQVLATGTLNWMALGE